MKFIYFSLISTVLVAVTTGCQQQIDLESFALCSTEECLSPVSSFSPAQETLFARGIVNNPGDLLEQKVSVIWNYLEYGEPVQIDSVELPVSDGSSVLLSRLTRPENGWPPGRYSVEVFWNNRDKIASEEFEIQTVESDP